HRLSNYGENRYTMKTEGAVRCEEKININGSRFRLKYETRGYFFLYFWSLSSGSEFTDQQMYHFN
ncbi:16215_t:CDS:2, partial [Funneliformis caledonium]